MQNWCHLSEVSGKLRQTKTVQRRQITNSLKWFTHRHFAPSRVCLFSFIFFVLISQLNICQAPLIRNLPISPRNAGPLTNSICWLLLVRSTELLNAELSSCRRVKQQLVCLCDFRMRVSGPTGRCDDNHAISSTSKFGRTLFWRAYIVLSVEYRYRSSRMSMIRTCYCCRWEDDCGLHMNSVNVFECIASDWARLVLAWCTCPVHRIYLRTRHRHSALCAQ